MKRIGILTLALMLTLANNGFAAIRTREVEPIIKKTTLGNEKATNKTVWTPSLRHVVCDSFIISSNDNQTIIISASDTLIELSVTASQPVSSPGNFLFRGKDLETILLSTEYGKTSVTFTGYEEP